MKLTVHSLIRAGIADGTLIVADGSDAGIQRGVTRLQQDGLKELFNAQKVAEQLELQQVAGQVAFTVVGDYARSEQRKAANDLVAARERGDTAGETAAQSRLDSWSDGGRSKTLLHGMAVVGIRDGDPAVVAMPAAGRSQQVRPAPARCESPTK